MNDVPQMFRAKDKLSDRKLLKRKRELVKTVSDKHRRQGELALKVRLLSELDRVFDERKPSDLAMLCQSDEYVFAWLLDRIGYSQSGGV